MARLPYLDEGDLAEHDRDLLKRPINLNRQLAHSPGAARAVGGIGHWIRYESKLDARLRELAILAVGYLERSPYEYSHHVKIGQDFGVSKADIRALERHLSIAEGSESDDTTLGALELAVLDAAQQLTDANAIEDSTYAVLGAALSKEEIVDLTVVIGFYNCVVRVLGGLQIDVEPGYQPYLDEFPLPCD